jgi:hypothetical protein
MVYIILLLLSIYAYKVISEAFGSEDSEFIVNNYHKLIAPKPKGFISVCPKIDFNKLHKQILSFIQYIKSLNIVKRMHQLSYIMVISIGIHIVALLIFGMIKFKKKSIENNWQVQLVPTEQEIKEIEVAELAPPPMEEGDTSMEGGNENKTDDYTQDIPIPEISDDILTSITSIEISPIRSSPKARIAKVNLGKFAVGNSSGKGNGYGFGNGNGRNGKGNGNGTGLIFGDKIIADKLGVILDISPSMTHHIPRLKSEIESNFKGARYREVNGCGIRKTSPTVYAIDDLSVQGIDAIYWFCDLQDNRTKEGLEKIKNILQRKGIRLYVKSLDFPPDGELQSVINQSGGSFLGSKLKTFSKL